MPRKKLPPIHPGEILLEEFLKPLGLTQYRLAKSLSVPPRRINEIAQGKRAITADTALMLLASSETQRDFGLTCRLPTISNLSETNSPTVCQKKFRFWPRRVKVG